MYVNIIGCENTNPLYMERENVRKDKIFGEAHQLIDGEITKIERAANLDFALVCIENLAHNNPAFLKCDILPEHTWIQSKCLSSCRNSQRMPSEVNIKLWT